MEPTWKAFGERQLQEKGAISINRELVKPDVEAFKTEPQSG